MKRKEPEIPNQYLDLLKEYQSSLKKPKTEPVSGPSTPLPQEHRASNPSINLEHESSEDEWDEIELAPEDEPEVNDVQINFASPKPEKKKVIPRETRLQIHASCLALLLLHTRIRNIWLHDPQIRTELRNAFPHVILQQLNPPDHLSNYLKSSNFINGLRTAARWWGESYICDKIGLYMVNWDEIRDPNRDVHGPMTKSEFIAAIMGRKGSDDELGQGFCALMRAHGFDTRLVCSLQPPDFSSPGKKRKPGARRTHPLFWAEVWDPFESQWITVDAKNSLVQVYRRDSPLEPTQADPRNLLRYCVAWSSDGTCRDVTRRYASKYVARTRKKRMDYFPKYASLYNQLMSRFAPSKLSPRDRKELIDLNRKELTEGFPSRVQDFIGHPLYVLEHQLKQSEVLGPKTTCGTLALKGEVIPIYHRKNVKKLRSSQTWYRFGRILKLQAQPLKYRSKRDKLTGVEERVALYSEEQTDLYRPPMVTDGVVPKSEYKTIDIFTPWMVPVGAAHVRHPLALKAAKALGVDYANAVVSVTFERTGPKSKYDGVVVPEEAEEGLWEAIKWVKQQQKICERHNMHIRRLYLWKQFIVAAQIRRRIDGADTDIKIEDEEPWPLYVPDMIESDSDDVESEAELTEKAKPDKTVKMRTADAEATPPHRTATSSNTYRVPLNKVIYHDPRPQVTLPETKAQVEDNDEEFPDIIMDELNESDLDFDEE